MLNWLSAIVVSMLWWTDVISSLLVWRTKEFLTFYILTYFDNDHGARNRSKECYGSTLQRPLLPGEPDRPRPEMELLPNWDVFFSFLFFGGGQHWIGLNDIEVVHALSDWKKYIWIIWWISVEKYMALWWLMGTNITWLGNVQYLVYCTLWYEV